MRRIAYEGQNTSSLSKVVEIAKSVGVAMIADAASELPPLSNLRRYLDEGADLVIFSGGKGIRGPQTSGLILGRRELVAYCTLNAFPNQNTIGRSMKVGKEEIAGLHVPVERVLPHDFAADADVWDRRVQDVIERLRDVRGVHREVISALLRPAPVHAR